MHHFFLVNFAVSHINVKNIRSGFNLGNSLIENIVEVVSFKSLFKFLLSRGIDSFADNSRLVKCNRSCSAADYTLDNLSAFFDLSFVENIFKFRNIFGTCSAAAA